MSALHVQTGEVGHFSAAALQPPHPAPITVNRLMSLRAAPIALLMFASLLGGFNLASHFAFVTSTPPAPINLSANFAFYAELGYPIQFCETGSVTGHSGATAPQCETLIDPQSLSRRSEMLGEGDYVWVQLDAEALAISQLMDLWGMPRLQREAEGGVRLVWELRALQVMASLNWGEPHHIPQQSILTLKHATSSAPGAPA